MFPVIDFRNGRYQGETKNQLPHGLGFFIDKNFMFCLAEWIAGQIKGNTIVIYPSGRIFFGQISYRQPQSMYSFELAEDHVQLITLAKPKKENQVEKLAAILPLLRIILDIDNTDRMKAKIIGQYQFSLTSEVQNLGIIANILKLDKTGIKRLNSYKNFIQYFRDKFLDAYPEILQFIVQQSKGKKQYFIGLRGQGLGIKIQPIEQLALNMKRTGKVYIVRAVGYFTKDNQLRDIGLKTLDNFMKGNIFEQGIFSLPESITKYEQGKRPINCSINFHNYIKRSLFYRDKVLNTEYVYELQKFVFGFNENLRKVETERLAQHTIENPNNKGQNLAEIQRKRREKEKQAEVFYKSKEAASQTPNPYNTTETKIASPDYNLNRVKEEIYRSASKKKGLPTKIKAEYYNTEYMDPNYKKSDSYSTRQPLLISNRPFQKSFAEHDNSRIPTSLLNKSNRSKSPYQYLNHLQEDSRPAIRNPSKYVSSRSPNLSFIDQNNYKSPPSKTYHRTANTKDASYNGYGEEASASNFRYERPSVHRPKYKYHFGDDDELEKQRAGLSPLRYQKR